MKYKGNYRMEKCPRVKMSHKLRAIVKRREAEFLLNLRKVRGAACGDCSGAAEGHAVWGGAL